MSIADEISKLDQLKKSGALTEEEFQQAKEILLENKIEPSESSDTATEQERENTTLGQAANRYVSFQMTMGVIGLVVFLIVLGTMCAKMEEDRHPRWMRDIPSANQTIHFPK
jgi:hypothetical protein